jgi:hypothetical protein
VCAGWLALFKDVKVADWKHKDEWRKSGTNFTIKVSRHLEDPSIINDDGGNCWCIYVYFYPKHPRFKEFDDSGRLWQEAANIGFHGGCSFLQNHVDAISGEVTSIQIGCDYNYLYDVEYTHYKTKEDASGIFYDAQDLFDKLERMNSV